jgi:hypothetical protein
MIILLSAHNKICAFACKLYMQEENIWIRDYNCVRFEVFTVVFKNNAVLWDVVQCGSHKNRCFGGTCGLHFQGRKKIHKWRKQPFANRQTTVCYQIANTFFVCRFFYPEDGGNTFLWNVGSYKTHTAPHCRSHLSEITAVCKHFSHSPQKVPYNLTDVINILCCHIKNIREQY